MLFSKDQHAANAPSTWSVRKSGNRWELTTKGGDVLDHFDTKTQADAAKISGRYFDLYEKERRWYAGESIPGWNDYKEKV